MSVDAAMLEAEVTAEKGRWRGAVVRNLYQNNPNRGAENGIKQIEENATYAPAALIRLWMRRDAVQFFEPVFNDSDFHVFLDFFFYHEKAAVFGDLVVTIVE